MEFGWLADDVRFREDVAAFVDAALPDWWDVTTETLTAGDDQAAWCREFAPKLAERGYLVPHWPAQYGGDDASAWKLMVLSEELWRRGEPRGQQYYSVNWVGPAIIRWGTEEQKRRLLPPMARGELRWCQGFSEPDAGSDLAGIRTLAIRDGDDYVVNGSKIWTSYATTAELCILVARTEPSSRRADGLSVLLVPMDTPGIDVREIAGTVGEHAFCEVFFTDVRVPVDLRLGPEHEGWKVALDALAFERTGAPRYARALFVLDACVAQLRGTGRLDDPEVARQIGEAVAACEAARILCYRVVDQRARAEPPTAEGNLARVATVWAEQLTADVIFSISGPDALGAGSIAGEALRSRLGVGVAAGTTEVNLTILAQRLLGLPKG